jgi:hypothetical protein
MTRGAGYTAFTRARSRFRLRPPLEFRSGPDEADRSRRDGVVVDGAACNGGRAVRSREESKGCDGKGDTAQEIISDGRQYLDSAPEVAT